MEIEIEIEHPGSASPAVAATQIPASSAAWHTCPASQPRFDVQPLGTQSPSLPQTSWIAGSASGTEAQSGSAAQGEKHVSSSQICPSNAHRL
jgi:hypothetical protein